jgi:curved DNA-binding protein
MRVRGRGLPGRDGNNGDLIVVTKIDVPAHVTDSERTLWEQLAKASQFNPRE